MKTIRIFISSPGDVAEERERARQVVEQLRHRYAGQFNLKPMLWEDLPLQADMSFQQGIDVVLSKDGGIDIAVFILWSRLGSPLGAFICKSDGSSYQSGTEREFDLIMTARERSQTGTPKILVYTRHDDVTFHERLRGKRLEEQHDLICQRKKLESFIQENFRDTSTGTNIRAYHSFDQPVTFSERLRVHLQESLDPLAKNFTGDPVWDIAKMGSPFRGLEVFEFIHNSIFFGREDEVLEVRRALQKKAQEGCAFVLISGASGSGKSSLARAGVLPSIVENEVDSTVVGWRHAVYTPSQLREPGKSLCAGLARLLCSDDMLPELKISGDSIEVLGEGFAKAPKLTVDQSLRPALMKAMQGKLGTTRLLVLIDQLEELFTDKGVNDQDREEFIAALESLARSGIAWVLGTVRSDFYQNCQQVPVLMRMKDGSGQIDLLLPTTDALRRLIEQPARLAGLSFEERDGVSLADRILNDATVHAELLPLVSYLLRELFEQRTPKGVLKWDTYRQLGGVEGALAKRVETVFSLLPDSAQRELNIVLRALVSVSGDEEESVVRQRVPLDMFRLGGPSRELVDRFVAERFLVTDTGVNGRGTVAVAHEALLRVWNRAAQWIADNREFLRARARVAARMKEGSRILDGDPLLELARFHLANAPAGFMPEQQAYIAESLRVVAKRRYIRRFAVVTALVLIFGFVILWLTQRVEDARAAVLAAKQTTSETDFTLAAYEMQKDKPQVSLAYLADALRENPRNAQAISLTVSILKDSPRPTMSFVHDDEVQDAIFSPDGKHLITASADGMARIWDTTTGAQIGQSMKHNGWVHIVNISSNGDWIVTASWDGTARIWNARTGEAKISPRTGGPVVMMHPNKVTDAVFSPDGSLIATACWDGYARIWDAQTGEMKTNLLTDKPVILPHGGIVWMVNFSPDGKRLVTASADRSARIWEVQTGRPIANPEGTSIVLTHNDEVNGASFSPDGDWIATYSDDGEIRIWNAQTGSPAINSKGKKIVMQHLRAVNSLAFSPDGSRIASASSDNTGRIWNVKTGEEIGVPMQHQGWVRSARFSPDGRLVVTASYDRTTRVWDAATGRPVTNPMYHGSAVYVANFSPDGHQIVTASFDDYARLWKVQGNWGDEPLNHSSEVNTASYSSDGKWAVTASADGTARVWNTQTGEIKSRPDGNPMVLTNPAAVLAANFSPDGNYILAALSDGMARLWSAQTGEEIGSPMAHNPNCTINTANFSPDGQWIVTASSDGSARIWNGTNGQLRTSSEGQPLILRPATMARFDINDARFSQDGTLVATASSEGCARIWSAQNGKELEELHHNGVVETVCFSPNGKLILTASTDHRAQLWDTSTGKPIGSPMRHDGWVYDAEFSPNGRWIVTASADGTARVWDAATGQPVSEPMQHNDAVVSARFSPNGRQVVTASSDGTARVWDAQTGKAISESLRDTDKDTDAMFSPDGRWILTASADGTARIWESIVTNKVGPEWLTELAEVEGRFHLNPQGALEPIVENPAIICESLSQLTNNDDLSRFGRWFVEDPSTRTISPNSSVTVPDFIQLRLQEHTPKSLQEAYDVDPGNPLVLTNLAEPGLAGDSNQSP